VKADHRQRVERLQTAYEINQRKGEVIEYSLNQVQSAINAVQILVASGMDWRDVDTAVREQQRQGNPVARVIAPNGLKLSENTITVILPDRTQDDEEDSDDEDDPDGDDVDGARSDDEKSKAGPNRRPQVRVDVSLGISAYSNAQEYFARAKAEYRKKEKTVESSEKAVRQAEQRTAQALKQVDVRAKMQIIRKVHWFEKFHWFISSENYLVIGGKDAQQNEMIVKRYMGKNDIYVHGDFHGASSVVIKNPHSDQTVPPKTLFQAGTMCVCRSASWTDKVPNSAYWVYSNQVSKTAPTGGRELVGAHNGC